VLQVAIDQNLGRGKKYGFALMLLPSKGWRSDKIMAEILSKPLAAKQVLTRSFFECKTF
jgi:hypothetical protein